MLVAAAADIEFQRRTFHFFCVYKHVRILSVHNPRSFGLKFEIKQKYGNFFFKLYASRLKNARLMAICVWPLLPLPLTPTRVASA